MSLIYKGSEDIKEVVFNNNEVNSIIYKGTTIWEKVITLDILNHGDIVGWNPLLNASSATKNTQPGYYSWTVNDSNLTIPQTANANIVFNGYIIDLSKYNSLHFIAESSGTNESYNYLTLGFRKVSSGLPSNYYGCSDAGGVNLILYSNSTNIDGTSPWYQLSKAERAVDISDLTETEVWLDASCCDNGSTFYSIWLSSEKI